MLHLARQFSISFRRQSLAHSAVLMTIGWARGAALLLPWLALACGGSATDAAESPQYVVVVQEELGPQRVFSISTLEARGTEELEAARQQGLGVEYSAFDLLFPWLREGTLVRFPEDRQSFTEIFVDRSGAHQPGSTYSIAELVPEPNALPFVPIPISPDKAYLLNTSSQRILVWDLARMAPRTLLSIQVEGPSGYSSASWTWAPVADDRFTLFTYWLDAAGSALATTVTMIDVNNDAQISQQTESRCTAADLAYESPTGDRYFSTGASAAIRHVTAPSQYRAPCMLRILAGQTEFDPTWQGSINDSVGSRAWNPIGTIPGGMLVQVADEREVQIRGLQAADADIWQYWVVQPDGSNARQLSALPPMTALVYLVADEKRRYVVAVDFNAAGQKYTDITDLDRPHPALSLPPRANVWRIRSLGYLYR